MLHLHVILRLKVCILFIPCQYSYTELIIENPFYLNNWNMRYSRMEIKLAHFCKVLGIYFTKSKTQLACSSNDI